MTSTVMGEEVRIVEKEGVKHKNPIVVEGLPDVGLVGTIAASYIVERMGYKEIGYIESNLFPPVMVVHEGKSKNPLRIYGDEGVVVVLSEVAIPVGAVYPLTEALADWVKEIGSKLVISMTGLPATNRIDIEKPEVFAVGNSEEALNELKDKQMELLEEGFIAGPYAIMLRECSKREISAISLLAQCFPVYPDPGAAASAIESLDTFLKLGIDVKELLEKGEEIKLKARDLMRQTVLSAPEMQKGVEQDMPIMYH
ncbi:MAG TPA: proteasome assembly chaperone family protein [Methanophagales archaeon]|nr:proteasome assembly chaperone family protein [Methanophagales archaeon]